MMPAPDYAAWKRQNAVFDRVEAMGYTFGFNLTSANRPAERVETPCPRHSRLFRDGRDRAALLGPGFDLELRDAQPLGGHSESDALGGRSYLEASIPPS